MSWGDYYVRHLYCLAPAPSSSYSLPSSSYSLPTNPSNYSLATADSSPSRTVKGQRTVSTSSTSSEEEVEVSQRSGEARLLLCSSCQGIIRSPKSSTFPAERWKTLLSLG